MQYDEYAFFNRQLAGMLQAGVPLEGALRHLCQEMRQGALRTELERLEADLAQGTPLAEAIQSRKLPELYVRMIRAAAQGNRLPGLLTLLADYYERVNEVAARLKGLMVYPLIVLSAAFLLSLTLTGVLMELTGSLTGQELLGRQWVKPDIWIPVWTPAFFLGAALLVVAAAWGLPAWRRRLHWTLPGFKEAKLAQAAAALRLFLSGGGTLADALGWLAGVEAGSPAGQDVARWERQLREGRGKFSEFAEGSRVFPPLFVWLVSQGEQDLAGALGRAADFYRARALQRTEMLLYAALPVAVLMLGLMVLGQMIPLVQLLTLFLNGLA